MQSNSTLIQSNSVNIHCVPTIVCHHMGHGPNKEKVPAPKELTGECPDRESRGYHSGRHKLRWGRDTKRKVVVDSIRDKRGIPKTDLPKPSFVG